jgi:hypothetical protein
MKIARICRICTTFFLINDMKEIVYSSSSENFLGLVISVTYYPIYDMIPFKGQSPILQRKASFMFDRPEMDLHRLALVLSSHCWQFSVKSSSDHRHEPKLVRTTLDKTDFVSI